MEFSTCWPLLTLCLSPDSHNWSPPPRYGFRSPPHFNLSAVPKVGEREFNVSQISDWIENKLTQEFQVCQLFLPVSLSCCGKYYILIYFFPVYFFSSESFCPAKHGWCAYPADVWSTSEEAVIASDHLHLHKFFQCCQRITSRKRAAIIVLPSLLLFYHSFLFDMCIILNIKYR